MPFQSPPVEPNLAQLISILQRSGLQQTNQPLYQVIWTLIQFVQQGNAVINNNISGGSNPPGASPNATYLTATDESAILPNSRELLAGTNVAFDDSLANERTVNVTIPTALDYVVASDGANPPSPLDDGFGNFIYVPYTP